MFDSAYFLLDLFKTHKSGPNFYFWSASFQSYLLLMGEVVVSKWLPDSDDRHVCRHAIVLIALHLDVEDCDQGILSTISLDQLSFVIDEVR
jgi:hypothetical protein